MKDRLASAQIEPLRPMTGTTSLRSFVRPLTSKFMINSILNEGAETVSTSRTVQDAVNKDKKHLEKISTKRSSYSSTIPESKKRVRHITGYNTVRLTAEDSDKNTDTAAASESSDHQKKQIHAAQRLSSAIDYSKQSPYLIGNENAEEIIMEDMAGGKEQLAIQRSQRNRFANEGILDTRQGNFLPLDYYNLDDDDLHPQ